MKKIKSVIDMKTVENDGYKLVSCVVKGLKDAGCKASVNQYLNELQKEAWSFEDCIRITKRYCVLK